MRRTLLWVVLVLGCEGADAPEGRSDARPRVDGGLDASRVADAARGADAAPGSVPDATRDAAVDATPDATPDAAFDATPDAMVEVAVDRGLSVMDGSPDAPSPDRGPVDAEPAFDAPLVDSAADVGRVDAAADDADVPGCDGGGCPPEEMCFVGQGACVRMGWVVDDRCDVEPGVPAAEACDGRDADCDGSLDEGCVCRPGTVSPCYTGPEGTAGVGDCRPGVRACQPDGHGWGACVGDVLPTEETCDGRDQDCDGWADDVFGLGEVCRVGLGRCAAEGVLFCHPGLREVQCGAVAGEPAAERCNGLDDDCDGQADELFGLGSVCVVGLGACRTEGTLACGAQGVVCVADRPPPGPERCNALDDDCDGRADEGLRVGEACAVGLGACARSGRLVCDGAGEVACDVAAGAPTDEVCGGADEDCDGRVDEGLSLGSVCVVGRGVCQRSGHIICDEHPVCDVVPGEGGPESCDGTDEDCDGAIDEGLGLGEACAEGVGACLREGRLVCDPARRVVTCSVAAGRPESEICGGADEDCDGLADEGLGLGGACSAGVGACNRPGVQVCAGAVVVCDAQAALPAAEACEGTDQDCDGMVDEGFGLGEVCGEGVGACERAGRVVCDGSGGSRCDAVPGAPTDETCDGVDQDCDGRVDEGHICLRVVVGQEHSCALLQDGRVKCWGVNGALGLGVPGDRGDEPGEMGAALPTVDLGGGRVAALAGGAQHTCALLTDGSVRCWGFNLEGQLGLGDTQRRGIAPDQMGAALPAVDLGIGQRARAISAGFAHTCVLLTTGAVKCWGANHFGQLGLGNTLHRGDQVGEMGDALPTVDLGVNRRAVMVSAGGSHTCAVLDNNTLKCWGYNEAGQLGLGDQRHRGDEPGEMGNALVAVSLGAGRRPVSVVAGHDHTCAVLDQGLLKCWGRNDYGQLGLGDVLWRGVAPPMGDGLPPVSLGTGRHATAVAVGSVTTCALLDDASVKCWGASNLTGLGGANHRGDAPGEMGDALPVVALGPGGPVVSIRAGAHTCVVRGDGTPRCWGRNNRGQLGLGHTLHWGDQAAEMGNQLPVVELD